ncbi:MAG: GH3 auxin-responsive promoter [Bacteroidetes bacterium 47-18]|nr:MAG: GH3 auxin-responsive promoter [Bacteroidetes bacterium 47-18]
MAILSSIIARSVKLRKLFSKKQAEPIVYQSNTLRFLIDKGQYTLFGKEYGFGKMLEHSTDLLTTFRNSIPYYNYDSIYKRWWHKCQEGIENVCWPGTVKYFALSSGTSESASKHIPVTGDMIKSIKKVGFKQFYTMTNFKIPTQTWSKGILMLGGTTSLFDRGDYYEGDMSGISAKNMPTWASNLFYKPGQKISKEPNWEDRIQLIVENAPNWDIGTLCGVPAWAQIVLDKIMKRYNLTSIHDIWPNLSVYIHGGVSFEPYRENFKQFFKKDVTFVETYMASEGSFGFMARPGGGIKLVLNAGIFYEFVPFNDNNFDENGDIYQSARSYLVNEVQEGVSYAVVISTCAGAWRYLIGDVVEFTNAAEHEIKIVGRTKQFLSLCGEHTSIDNLNKTINILNRKLKANIKEFTVAGYPYENLFAHTWYIGSDDPIDKDLALKIIDETLCELNDDYAVERTSALKEVFLEVLPTKVFIDYLKYTGKYGAMNKFPRVLKGARYEDWKHFIRQAQAADKNGGSALN